MATGESGEKARDQRRSRSNGTRVRLLKDLWLYQWSRFVFIEQGGVMARREAGAADLHVRSGVQLEMLAFNL